MEKSVNKNWWFLAINGVVAILFGVLLIFFSEALIKTIILYCGLAILLAGLILMLLAIRNMRQEKKIALLVVQSVTAIALGLIMLLFRENTLAFFLIMIGVWAVIIGIFQLVILINIPKKMPGKNFLLFNGILTMALGVFLIIKPLEFATFMVIVTGTLAILFGIGMIYMAVLIRRTPMLQVPVMPEIQETGN